MDPANLIDYRYNPRAKRLILRLDDKNQRFVLTIPPRVTQSQIDEFLATSQTWMIKQKATMVDHQTLTPGQTISVLGKVMTMRHDPVFTVRSVNIKNDEIWVYGPKASFAQQCESFLKKHAQETFNEWCEDIVANLPRSFWRKPRITSLVVKDTKSRWGSCSSQGAISLSWRLIFAPRDVARYVCIHECCHLLEMNHSDRFWDLVSIYDQDYKDHKNWLKKHGKTLFSYRPH